MTYQARIVDAEISELRQALPAIALEGPKGVGKTATALRRATHVFDLDLPATRELIAADFSRLDHTAGTVLIDEWQHLPSVWDYVRRQVDSGAVPGRYLLTGSALPTQAPSHSGAGRIVQVRMRPLSLAERALTESTVSLAELLRGRQEPVTGSSPVDLAAYVEEILASGFPGIRQLRGRARRAQLAGYLTRILEHDFPEQGFNVRRPATLRAWLEAYAAATSTTTSYNSLLDAATAGVTGKPAKTTTIAYRDILTQLWVLDPVPGWLPGRGHLNRLTQAPKHQLVDPALAAQLLGIDAGALLSANGAESITPRDGTLLGNLFESLVTQSVRVYAQANEATVHHLRTQRGDHEVDLIVERPDRRVLAIEVKLSASPDVRSVTHLNWLRKQIGTDLLDAVIVTAGQHAYRRPDGIAVIPAALLGP